MDRVRLGRALGRGARAAAQTLYETAAAAAAPAPARSAAVASTAQPARASLPQPTPARPAPPIARSAEQATVLRAEAAAVPRPARSRPAKGLLDPVKRASRAVSLQISGSFFALFALSFFAGAFRFQHGSLGPRVWVCFAIAAMFAYFAIGNFWRAHRLSHP